MKILFADKFPAPYLKQIQEMGHECTLNPDLTADDLPASSDDFEALVVRSTKVTADTINAAESL